MERRKAERNPGLRRTGVPHCASAFRRPGHAGYGFLVVACAALARRADERAGANAYRDRTVSSRGLPGSEWTWSAVAVRNAPNVERIHCDADAASCRLNSLRYAARNVRPFRNWLAMIGSELECSKDMMPPALMIVGRAGATT